MSLDQAAGIAMYPLENNSRMTVDLLSWTKRASLEWKVLEKLPIFSKRKLALAIFTDRNLDRILRRFVVA